MQARPTTGGGVRYEVAPGRVSDWYARFTGRHGPATVSAAHDVVDAVAADGTRAQLEVPFPPLAPRGSGGSGGGPMAALADHAARSRLVGVLLVRLGGFAAGIFSGEELIASRVGSRPVHGRSAAGGQSQQRFARRREGQVRVATAAAADTAARVLLPYAARLDGLVLGGDRRLSADVLADPRLAALRQRVTGPLLDVPDPPLRVLRDTPRRFRAVRVREWAPQQGPGPSSG